MSIDATRARSTFAENSLSLVSSACCLFSSSAPFLRAATVLSRSTGRGRFWTMAVLGLTVCGLKLCYEALNVLKVCIMWIRIWGQIWKQGTRTHDEDTLATKNDSIERRQMKIENSLTTTTYKALVREADKHTRQTRQEEIDHNEDDEHRHLCSSSSTLSSNGMQSTTATTIIQPRVGKSCVICLETFGDNDKISFAKRDGNDGGSCNHIFHSTCLQVWLKKHTSCPMCRYCMLADS